MKHANILLQSFLLSLVLLSERHHYWCSFSSQNDSYHVWAFYVCISLLKLPLQSITQTSGINKIIYCLSSRAWKSDQRLSAGLALFEGVRICSTILLASGALLAIFGITWLIKASFLISAFIVTWCSPWVQVCVSKFPLFISTPVVFV